MVSNKNHDTRESTGAVQSVEQSCTSGRIQEQSHAFLLSEDSNQAIRREDSGNMLASVALRKHQILRTRQQVVLWCSRQDIENVKRPVGDVIPVKIWIQG